jgi:hypothetical protein
MPGGRHSDRPRPVPRRHKGFAAWPECPDDDAAAAPSHPGCQARHRRRAADGRRARLDRADAVGRLAARRRRRRRQRGRPVAHAGLAHGAGSERRRLGARAAAGDAVRRQPGAAARGRPRAAAVRAHRRDDTPRLHAGAAALADAARRLAAWQRPTRRPDGGRRGRGADGRHRRPRQRHRVASVAVDGALASHLAGAIEGLRAAALQRETAVAEERSFMARTARLHRPEPGLPEDPARPAAQRHQARRRPRASTRPWANWTPACTRAWPTCASCWCTSAPAPTAKTSRPR